MITRVQIKNFRNLADVDVHLGPLTVLVGRNGAGKSTFLDALRFVRDALKNGLDTAISQSGGIEAIRRRTLQNASEDIEITLEVQMSEGKARYSFIIGTEQTEYRRVKSEALHFEVKPDAINDLGFETKDGKWIDSPTDFIKNKEPMLGMAVPPDTLVLPALSKLFPIMNAVFYNIVATSCYSVFPNTLRIPQRQSSVSLLSEDGQNLATTLRSILNDGEFQPDLISGLSRIVEGVTDIRVVELGGYLVIELRKTQGQHPLWFPLAQESDGTLRVLALLAALYQKAPHSLIAIRYSV